MAFVLKRQSGALEVVKEAVLLDDGRRISLGTISEMGPGDLASVSIFNVPDPTPPMGQVLVSVTYLFSNGSVSAVPTFGPAPLNIIPFSAFIGRWTTAEYALLMQRRATAITNGGATAMTMVMQWDQSLALGAVDLNTQAAQDFKANLVTNGILTQARADAIFS